MLDVAVLGLGSIGMRHAKNLLFLGQRVVGFDPDPGRRDRLTAEGGLAVSTRAEALETANAVVVATPNDCHLADLAAALDARRHIFIEKPLSHTLDGVGPLLQSAQSSGLVVFSGLNLRYHPAVLEAKRLLDEEVSGRPISAHFIFSDFLPAWRPGQDYKKGYAANPRTGGVMFDAIHEFDLAWHLMGPATTTAAAAFNTGLLEMDSEDCADIILRHIGGRQTSIHLDYVGQPRIRRGEISCQRGRIELDLDARRLRLFGSKAESAAEQVFPGSYATDYVDEMRAFLNCVESGGIPACPAQEAASVLKLVLDARKLAGLTQG